MNIFGRWVIWQYMTNSNLLIYYSLIMILLVPVSFLLLFLISNLFNHPIDQFLRIMCPVSHRYIVLSYPQEFYSLILPLLYHLLSDPYFLFIIYYLYVSLHISSNLLKYPSNIFYNHHMPILPLLAIVPILMGQ